MEDPSVENITFDASFETPAVPVSPQAVRGIINIQSKWRGDRVRDGLVWSDTNGDVGDETSRWRTEDSIKESIELDSSTTGTTGTALRNDTFVSPMRQDANLDENLPLVAAAAAEARRAALDEARAHADELREQLAKAEEVGALVCRRLLTADAAPKADVLFIACC